MNNQGLLWMNPLKQGLLKKRGGKRKNWKVRQFLVKDTFLVYFKKYRGDQLVWPSGVVPLQGSKVDLSPCSGDETEGFEPPPTYVFVIFLPDKLLTEGMVKRNTYFLGGDNLTDCYLWIKAIRHASISRRIVKGQLKHAKMELIELEARWNLCQAIDKGELSAMEAMFDENVGENPLILQALSDELMILYRLVEISDEGLKEEQAKKALALNEFEMIQHLKDLQLQELSKQGKRVHAEADYKRYHTQIGALIKKRFELRHISNQVQTYDKIVQIHSVQLDMYEGKILGGPGLPLMSFVENMLLTTLQELKKLEEVSAGAEKMPREERILELELAMVPRTEEYLELLDLATSGEKKHETIMLAAEAAANASRDSNEEELSPEEASFRSSLLTGGFS